MKREPIILIGGGGHCKSCIDVVEAQGFYSIIGIVDMPEKRGQKILGYEIIGCDDDLPELRKKCASFLISLGQILSPDKRISLYNTLKSIDASLPVIKSPYSYISQHSSIGEGTIIMHGAIVNAGASIGVNCIINSKALIEHDAIISDFCHISTGGTINGGSCIGKGTFWGSEAVCKENISVEEYNFIKANSTVK